MSTASTRARQIELDAAQRRVVERLKATAPKTSSTRKRAAENAAIRGAVHQAPR